MSNFKKWTDYILATTNNGEFYANADFSKASVVIDRMEGGYSTDKNDKGNYLNEADYNARRNFIGTNWGISAPVLASWRGRAVTQSEMKSLTYDEALKIYKAWYWDAIDGDKINNDSVAFIIYDSAVNQGVGGMKKVYKNATGESYSADSVNNYKDQEKLFELFKQARIKSYGSSQAHITRVGKFLFEKAVATQKYVKKNIVPIIIISTVGAAIIGTVLYLVITKKIK